MILEHKRNIQTINKQLYTFCPTHFCHTHANINPNELYALDHDGYHYYDFADTNAVTSSWVSAE